MDEDNAEALLLLGKLLIQKKESAKAAATISKAIRILEESGNEAKASSFFYLGQAYEYEKEYQKAIDSFKKCLQREERNFGAAIHLASILQGLNEIERSHKYFAMALQIDHNSIAANYAIGKLYQEHHWLAE